MGPTAAGAAHPRRRGDPTDRGAGRNGGSRAAPSPGPEEGVPRPRTLGNPFGFAARRCRSWARGRWARSGPASRGWTHRLRVPS